MKTFAEALASSRDVPAFANSTEGHGWMAAWCDRCLVDAPFRSGLRGATGCSLIAVALRDRIPAEWIDGPRDDQGSYSIAEQYHCVEFRPRNGGGGEPTPTPTPRDQLELFGRDGHENRRTLVPLPDRNPAPAVGAAVAS